MAKTIYLQDPQKFNLALAEALKKVPEMKMPEWAGFVKTGTSKERVPYDSDYWYNRAASILRQLYLRGVVGVGKLRTRYGGRKRRGGRPDEFRKAGGKIIRAILQQAETAGIVEKIATNKQFGRRLTQKGRDFLDSIEVPKAAKTEVDETPKEKTQEVKQEVAEDADKESDKQE